MAKYFIIGETGSNDLWLVDVDNRSVEPVTDAALQKAGAADPGFIGVVDKARRNGITTIKGVSIAIATNSRSEAETESFFVDPDPRKK
ncbi:hypothetical protein SAMN05428967_3356 [Phyllobacterium sp. YR620]|uniref:hypothetical protein n=1 Tax=Phyllobacterium TaxID=28100 RepID=UPI0004808A62|nr:MULTISPECIES: hypothetical protein [unclassified Phyllobacterium]UGY10715.1 hypothetical protein LLE51_005975 [Phyllobacterium sp. T1018]SDP77217.1 hypothetical protein SAMN05428967_3356 [Phyllobacterium sp. YR620]